MSTELLTDITIFVLALLVGFEVISKVPATLHTPLMSAANSIHGIVLAGAMLIAVTANNALGYILAFVAAAFAAMNVVGGYMVTGRMLKMFHRTRTPVPAADSPAAVNSPQRRRPVMNNFDWITQLLYVAAAVCFVFGLHLMNSPASARRGNQVSTAGMALAIATTFALVVHAGTVTATGWIVMVAGALIGAGAGLYSARTVQMTAMPQLVSLFNAVGGGAAALVGINDYVRLAGATTGVPEAITITTVLDVLIGAVTFSGSIIAAGKLQGLINGAPVTFPGSRAVNIAAAVVGVGGGIYMIATPSVPCLIIIILAALAFGVTMVMPIGGADMPVVISLLNAFTGTAVAMAGFVIGNMGTDHRRRAGRRVRQHPDQADGRRDEPLAAQHHDRRVRHRRQRPGGGRARRRRAVCAGRRRGDPARLRAEGHHRARVRPGRRPGAAPGRRTGRAAGGARRSRSATPSTRSRAGCPGT